MAMRLILNENIPRNVVEALRAGGHDVLSVKELMRGASDAAVVQRANDERRLVVTQDKDFGELAFRQGMRAASGVILFRLTGSSPDADLRRMVSVIEGRTAWEGIFAVATDSRLRLRFHPPKPPNGNSRFAGLNRLWPCRPPRLLSTENPGGASLAACF